MRVIKSINSMDDNEKKILYMCNSRPVFKSRALFADATDRYRSPSSCSAGDVITLRLRTGKFNVDKAYVYVDGCEYSMDKRSSDDFFDYYEASFTIGENIVNYYYKVEAGKSVVYYYNQIGAARELNPYYNFRIIPGHRVPEWVKGAVMYQIYVDRFCDGDRSNNVLDHEYSYIGEHVVQVLDWDKYPSAMGVREFYGGDLAGVWSQLDYLQELGVEVIYFNPLFVSPSNHKYDIQDYDYIDPHIGRIVVDEGELLAEGDLDNTHASRYISRVTDKRNLEASNAYFAELVKEIHSRGMKVIIDGVFNHCGSFNKWLDREHLYSTSKEQYDKGAYESYDSPYHNFFKFYGDQWPNNGSYDGWWGHDTLPKLNYEESKELENYILEVGRKWVSEPYNVDGWRLDVAADLGYSQEYNHEFWRRFRAVVKEANPEAVILAEHYGDCNSWLSGGEWDTIMNYDAFMEPLTWFLTGMEKHSDEYRHDMLGNASNFFGAMHHNMSRMGEQAVEISMNQLSNHDHSRFLTRTNRIVGRTATVGPQRASENIDKACFMEAVVVQMTWPGAPTLYYGDEAGVCGWTDPDNRRTYPWGHEDQELIAFHKEIIKLHKSRRVLSTGSYKQLVSDYNLIAYGRFDEEDTIIVVVNNSDDERRVLIPAWEVGVMRDQDMQQLFVTYDGTYSTADLGYSIQEGWLDLGIRRQSAVVLGKM